ncbi:MAG: ComEC/Rec2 family competence protein [Pseudobdellovibrionaceae bacterium]
MLEVPTASLKALSHFLHENCVSFRELLPVNSATQSAFGSLVCASDNTEPLFEQFFSHTGLYHLLVVSGSHLIVLVSALELAQEKRWISRSLSMAVVALYCLITDLQAPLLRSLIQWILQRFWSPRNSLLLSGLICLMAFPSWIQSWSLYLSWLASAALCLRPWPLFWAQAAMALPFRSFSFIALLCNLGLAPLLSASLFTSSWLSLLSPKLSQLLIEAHLGVMIWCLQRVPGSPPTELPTKTPQFLDWLILSVVLSGLSFGISWRRRCFK